MRKIVTRANMVLAIIMLSTATSPVLAANQTEFSQAINTGVLRTTVLDASQATVSAPSLTMTPTSVSMQCQTTTGTYGANTQRVYIENPGASASGWVLSIAATGGSSAKWDNGSQQYNFNSAAGSGCTNGQMTIDPSVSTVNAQSPSTATGMSKGSSASFVSGSVDNIELLNAGASSDDYWWGYVQGISVSQKIPGSTPAGTYKIDLTQTVVAQ